MQWGDVRLLHIEISALCNAACPACARYPTASYFVHPYISTDDTWTVDQVKKRLPPNDICKIEKFYINGTLGDFIANFHALEIVEYFHKCAPNSSIHINTNGSARTQEWWTQLGSIPNVCVNFAIDGLQDTHALYRRNTDWNQIISNARAFISAGGIAEWTMTIFKHNEHQISACNELANEYGFVNFVSRFNDRNHVPVRDRNGKTVYHLESADSSPIKALVDRSELEMVRKESYFKQHKIIAVKQERLGTALTNGKQDCASFTKREIYISSQWAVVPCCFLGNAMFYKESDRFYKDIVDLAGKYNINVSSLFATDNRTVSTIVNEGFDWIYENLTTDNALSICYNKCNTSTSSFKQGQNNLSTKKLQNSQKSG